MQAKDCILLSACKENSSQALPQLGWMGEAGFASSLQTGVGGGPCSASACKHTVLESFSITAGFSWKGHHNIS